MRSLNFFFFLFFINLSANNYTNNGEVEEQFNYSDEGFCCYDVVGSNDKENTINFLNLEIVFPSQSCVSFDPKDLVYKGSKKKKEKAAAVFCGLANIANSLGQVISGNPKEGVTNFVGTIFSTVAQIAQIEANYSKEPSAVPLKNYLIFNLMVDFTESLYQTILNDTSRDVNLLRFPALKELSLISIYAERVSWIAQKILDNSFIQDIIKEALEYLEIYLHEKVDEVLAYLREKLLISPQPKVKN